MFRRARRRLLAISSAGNFSMYLEFKDSVDEAVRRALEFCGSNAGFHA